jgi:hypothetical protein
MDKVGLSSSYCLNLCGHHDHRSVRETWIVKLLDSCKFRELTWLITELNANPGYFTISLEVFSGPGWLEKNTAHKFDFIREE